MKKALGLIALLVALTIVSVAVTAPLTGCVVRKDKGFDEAD